MRGQIATQIRRILSKFFRGRGQPFRPRDEFLRPIAQRGTLNLYIIHATVTWAHRDKFVRIAVRGGSAHRLAVWAASTSWKTPSI